MEENKISNQVVSIICVRDCELPFVIIDKYEIGKEKGLYVNEKDAKSIIN